MLTPWPQSLMNPGGGHKMVNKIRNVIEDEHFGDYALAALPIVLIILGAIAFAAISLTTGQ